MPQDQVRPNQTRPNRESENFRRPVLGASTPFRKSYFRLLGGSKRLKTILGVAAKHGFHSLVVRAKLSRFVFDRLISKDLEQFSTPERVRMSFEKLGPTFVKLGQLLATRPDLIPPEFSEEFKKLHDQVPGVPFGDIRAALTAHFGAPPAEIFSEFDETPLAAASIAQVHRARLKDGSRVVVKVQRPGIERIIREDLDILKGLAQMAERYIPELRAYNPRGIVAEFGRSMEFETNFVVEANNVRRFSTNFAGEPHIKIPKVYSEFTGRRVLVLEELDGIPLSQKSALEQEGVHPEEVLRRGLRAYMKMVDGHCGALRVDVATRRFVCSAYATRPETCRELARASGACRGEIAAKRERPLMALGRRG